MGEPLTNEMMALYIQVLEKQVSQMVTVVNTLEELHDQMKAIEHHFNNGFKSEIMEHTTEQSMLLLDKAEKSLTTTYINKELLEKAVIDFRDAKGLMTEIRNNIKIDRGINIIGWSAFIISMLTVLLKAFGKL